MNNFETAFSDLTVFIVLNSVLTRGPRSVFQITATCETGTVRARRHILRRLLHPKTLRYLARPTMKP